jgi:hypothetical protein
MELSLDMVGEPKAEGATLKVTPEAAKEAKRLIELQGGTSDMVVTDRETGPEMSSMRCSPSEVVVRARHQLPTRRRRRTELPSWSRATLQCVVSWRSSGVLD